MRLFATAIYICWGVVIAVWIAGWLYNFSHAPAVVRRSGRFQMGGWTGCLSLFVLVWLLGRFVPVSFWLRITYWNRALALVGVVVLIVGTLFTLWARWALGTMWTGTPTIKEHHELRTDGPYGVTRHPIYSGLLLMLFGTMLIAGFGATAVGFVVLCVYLIFKIRTEERLLLDTFGDQYRAYRQRIPALIPGLPRG